jgi:hypothetical protein
MKEKQSPSSTMNPETLRLTKGAKALDPDTLFQMIAGTTISLHRSRRHSKDLAAELKRLLKINDEQGGI